MTTKRAIKAETPRKRAATPSEAELYARRYLEDAARIMRTSDEAPMLSGKRYESAVRSIARTFETVRSAR